MSVDPGRLDNQPGGQPGGQPDGQPEGQPDTSPAMRVTVRVRPGASRTRVGGSYDDALVVRVQERAVDGRATAAALRAVAEAVGVPRRSVRLVSGATSRTKVFEIDRADPVVLRRLLGGTG
jgi:uncharacterized protein YggU (UPF0235/DUF167 family)